MSSTAANSKLALQKIAIPAAVVLLAGLSLFYSLRGDGQITPLASLPESVADITKMPRVAEIQPSQVAIVNGRLGGLATRGTIYPSARDRMPNDIAAALAQLHKNAGDARMQQAERDQMIAELEARHKAESIDSTWAAQSEVDILSASVEPVMVQAGFNPRDVATDCRSQTCRISARFADSNDAQSWGSTLVTQMGTTLSQIKMTVLPQTDGSSEVRIYGARSQSPRS